MPKHLGRHIDIGTLYTATTQTYISRPMAAAAAQITALSVTSYKLEKIAPQVIHRVEMSSRTHSGYDETSRSQIHTLIKLMYSVLKAQHNTLGYGNLQYRRIHT